MVEDCSHVISAIEVVSEGVDDLEDRQTEDEGCGGPLVEVRQTMVGVVRRELELELELGLELELELSGGGSLCSRPTLHPFIHILTLFHEQRLKGSQLTSRIILVSPLLLLLGLWPVLAVLI